MLYTFPHCGYMKINVNMTIYILQSHVRKAIIFTEVFKSASFFIIFCTRYYNYINSAFISIESDGAVYCITFFR